MADSATAILVDSYPDDDNYAESSASELTSLRSSITDYVYENGRRYHAYHSGSYWGSNDEKAIQALDAMYVISSYQQLQLLILQ